MKRQIIRTIGIIAAIIVIISTVQELNIAGLTLLSLSIMIFSLLYDTKKQFEEDKMHEKNWKLVLVAGLSIGGISLVAGILKIIDVLYK
ncbi:hypothetical protein GOQ29_05650 [Clostridium sp. D2Q-14]|uniref:hypothetical protein n=1 Tax=Anaeromonas gelatinilytica TaxID=2683194 RepID=UPI00193C7750|nr:hypothetical protein [Anaeromonas gelatinilytica]MBS4535102.1 hypothetical protein [Anaeromonas gelatinilytica]